MLAAYGVGLESGSLGDAFGQGAVGFGVEGDVFFVPVRDAAFQHYSSFDELLDLFFPGSQRTQDTAGQIVRMAQYGKAQMVRRNVITAGAHSLFAGIGYNGVEFV